MAGTIVGVLRARGGFGESDAKNPIHIMAGLVPATHRAGSKSRSRFEAAWWVAGTGHGHDVRRGDRGADNRVWGPGLRRSAISGKATRKTPSTSWPVLYRPPTGQEANHVPDLRRHGGWPGQATAMTGGGVIAVRTIGCGDRGGGGPRFRGKRHEKPHSRHGRSCTGHPPGRMQITIAN